LIEATQVEEAILKGHGERIFFAIIKVQPQQFTILKFYFTKNRLAGVGETKVAI
jgi:hypothetical protein